MAQKLIPMADCHNDLLLGVLHQQERGIADPFGDFWLPQLKAGGVALQVLPVYVEEQFIGEGALRRTLLLLECAWKIEEKYRSEVAICLNRGDIAKAISEKKIALILALEGSEGMGSSLEVIDVFYRMGVRMMSLSWNRRTMMADGVGERDTGGKLTALGVQAVAELERLGIVLDISHLSENGFWHVNEVAKKPFIASHSSCFELRDHPRNLRDAQLKAVAASGGFVALNGFGEFLSKEPTVESYVDHAEYAVNMIGSQSVALGLDFGDGKSLGDDHALHVVIGRGDSLKNLQALKSGLATGALVGEHAADGAPDHTRRRAQVLGTTAGICDHGLAKKLRKNGLVADELAADHCFIAANQNDALSGQKLLCNGGSQPTHDVAAGIDDDGACHIYPIKQRLVALQETSRRSLFQPSAHSWAAATR